MKTRHLSFYGYCWCFAVAVMVLLAGWDCPAQEVPMPAYNPGQPTLAPPAPPVAPPPVSREEKLGEAPPDYSHEFLRQDTVLLKPGDWQVDVGLNYTIYDHSFTGIQLTTDSGYVTDATPIDARLRQRLLVMPIEIRFGLMEKMQLFANLPAGWTHTEEYSFGIDEYDNDGGIGDTSAGFSYMLYKGDGWLCFPDVVATFGFTAPTSKSNLFQALYGTPQTTLGQGVWAGFWNVIFLHTYDPVTVFYGFGSRHAFTREFDGFDVLPGDQYTYRGGVGFAVNERITLSASLYGYYITEARLNGQRVLGTVQEPIYLRFAATMLRRCDRIWEPFAEIGMTEDAANSRFGITWTF